MARSYNELVNLAAELGAFPNFLSTEEEKREKELQNAFNGARNKFVFDLYKEHDDPEEMKAVVAAEIAELQGNQPEWAETLSYVENEIFLRIDSEAGSSKWGRMLRSKALFIVIGIVAAIYLGIRFTSGVAVDAPFETKEGIQQRAEALAKAFNHDDLMSGRSRRGNWIKPILFWPVAPTDAELAAANEMGGTIYGAMDYLEQSGLQCSFPQPSGDDYLSEGEIEMLEAATEYFTSENVEWQEPPMDTILMWVAEHNACAGTLSIGDEQAPAAEAE